MRITLKTAGLLGKYLPAGSAGNSASVEVAEAATALEVMRQLGFPEDRSYLVLLNGASVSRANRATQELAENDELSVLPPLKGG